MNPRELFFTAIKSQFPWAECTLPCREDIDDTVLKEAYSIAIKQDMGHLFCSAAIGLVGNEEKQEFNKQRMLAVFRREQISFEESRIFALFDENGIDFIPLKGSVIKGFYPQEWMRTSSDTDILIHPEDGERAIALLQNSLSYRYEGKSAKDFQLFSQSGVHLELHYSPEGGSLKTDKVISRIWDYAEKDKQNTHKFNLTNEFLIFHTISHAVYHFLGGGCGVKPVLDYWVMSAKADYDAEKLQLLINESGCQRFFDGFCGLASVWFEGDAHSELTQSMEDYILGGGVYGSRENLGKAKAHREGGKVKYLVSRVFKPKKELALQYPNLENKPWLLPYYQVKRWFNLFNKDRRRDVSAEISGGLKKSNVEDLFNKLGI